MTREIEFTEDVADVLREVGSIGAGHAASALSVLLAQQVGMSVPSARMVPFEAVSDIVGGPDSLVAAVYLRVAGVLDGHLLSSCPARVPPCWFRSCCQIPLRCATLRSLNCRR